jgi:hypothetical protein
MGIGIAPIIMGYVKEFRCLSGYRKRAAYSSVKFIGLHYYNI